MLKLRVKPIHPWTIGQTAAFPAFQLTSEATVNCLQQSDAKELRNAKSHCLKTTLHFLCTQNLAQALSSWFHWHFLLKLVQLSSCWSHGQILRQGSRDITKQNRFEKTSVSMGTTVRSKQSEQCERTAEREVWLLENNLALFVYSMSCANFVLLISLTLFTHTRTTLKLFDKWVEHHQTKLLWKEMGVNEDNSPKQAVGTMRKNCGTRSLAAWKQPCTFCALKTLRKLCPPDFIDTFYSHSYNSHDAEVMDKFFNKGVGTSPNKTALKRNWSQWGQQSEASSHAKELRNAKSRCLKTTLGFLCTQNIAQTLSSWFHSHFLLTLVQLSSYSTSESNITRQNCSEKKWVSWGQQSEASSRNNAKELRNAKSGCLKTTLHFLCTQCLAQTLSSWFHSHFLLTLVQLSSYSTSITSQNCSEKKSVSTGTTVRSKQSERCERTAEREVSLLENNLALFV